MTSRECLYKLKWRRYHPTAFERFAELMRNERRTLDELMARQESARQAIVRGAMEHTSFYPKFYGAAGFEIGDIGKDGWFERLPVVTKKELREHFDGFVNPDLRQFLKVSTTGGSTGTPTKTGYDGRAEEEVYPWRLQSWFGVHPWDDHAYVWRDTRKSWPSRFKNGLLWWPTKHLKLDASFLTDAAIAEFLKKFNRLRPAMLQGYVGALDQVARYAVDHHFMMWSPKFVWSTSAPIRPSNRALIERAFGAPVCDQYGSCEIRWIAQQCSRCAGLHVNVEHVNIEFVDGANRPVPKGEYGRTLLTNLEDVVFPLIRYENGDRGRWLTKSCDCGRTLPVIDSVKGREVESFVMPSGKTINGEYLTTIFDATPDLVSNFRVTQHAADLSIDIDVIPRMRSASQLKQIQSVIDEFEKKICREVRVGLNVVDKIQSDRGKLRFVVRD